MTEPRWLVGGGAALAIAPEGATVWWLDLDEPATRRRADAIASLPGEAALFARHADAGERAMRRRLARLMLAAAADCAPHTVMIGRDRHGAPVVEAPAGWHLSLAARWPDCLIAIARQPLGVDVERIGGAVETDLLSAAERQMFAGMSPAEQQRAFAQNWAAKEAHAKWTGRPREVDPPAVEVTGTAVSSRWGTTRLWQREIGRCVAAVCLS